MTKRKIKRRDFLKLSGTATLGAVLASCSTAPVEEEPTDVPVVEEVPEPEPTEVPEAEPVVEAPVEVVEGFGEAPLLAERVAAGDLPPVEERMPVAPAVVGQRAEIGVYGGEARMMNLGWNWFTSMYGWFSERFLDYSDLDLRTLIPNIFESWEMSEDGKTFTFHLREGLKWSDGVPFTTEEVDFWWNDFANYEGLGWVNWQFRFGGENAQFDFIDDYTFKMTFVSPFGQFPAHITRWFPGMDAFSYLKHYMKQFHEAYADEAELAALVEEAGFETWQGLFFDRGQWGVGMWMATTDILNVPTLAPWRIIEKDDNTAFYFYERNPYYWKVDEAGNQLPYLDNIRIEYSADTTIVTQKIIQGELDYAGPHDVSMARFPLYKENEPDNTYIVADYLSSMIDRYVLFPQHTVADEVLAEIVQHPNFVKALSVAIDREEINQSLYFGQAKMGQLSPMPNSKYYKEEYGTAWAQYDPTLANQLLDEMGLDQLDDEGFRLRSDGERLRYNIEHAGSRVGVVTGEYTEMVVSFWRDVGIDATTEEIEEGLLSERMQNSEVHCTIWHADRCTDTLMPLEMDWFIPLRQDQGGASSVWASWYDAADRTAEDLVEPPEYMKQLYEWHDQMNSVIDEDERVAIGQKIFDYLAENPISIGSVLECPAPLIFNKNFRNLPRPKIPIGWDSYGVGMYRPEAFFYEGGERA
jgi:peptide/nickel transport system substrate-binding protein